MTRGILLAWIGCVGASAAFGAGGWPEALERGRLDEASVLLEAAVEGDSPGHDALFAAGRLALWKNRLDVAESRLQAARERGADAAEVAPLLAEVAYRRRDPAAASKWLESTGEEGRVAQLAKAAVAELYRLEGPASGEIEFVQTDPLPALQLSVNGSEPALFIVDTGGGELILDPEFAEKVGAEVFGARSGTFAGDAKTEVGIGHVRNVTMGPFEVHNVPVRLLPTGRFMAATWGRPVAGVLGTTLLRQFRFTLDYPGGRLALERADAPSSAGDVLAELPIWLVGDHLIVAEGCVGRADPLMVLLDTGLAGGALTVPASTIEEAGIELSDVSFEGQGGGGAVTVRPFVVDRVCLGSVERSDLTGFAGPFPESLEHKLGFRLGGLVSHGFLRPYSVTFDFESMSMTLREPKDE